MLLEAYVLPDTDGATGVVFLSPRPVPREEVATRGDVRSPAALTLAVYGPGPVSSADLALATAALATATGDAIGLAPRWRVRLALWWVLGAAVTAGLVWRALDAGPAYAFVAAMVGFLALPPLWTIDDRPHQWWRPLLFWRAWHARLSRRTAGNLARGLAFLETTRGQRADTLDQVNALWAMARRADGAPATRLASMASHCKERGWPHVAAWYTAHAAAERLPRAVPTDTSARWTTFEGTGR
ncbi:MAG: hypothetical protein ACKO2D_09455 [Chloroflexota bacterium]